MLCSFGENLLKPDEIQTVKIEDILDYMTFSEKLDRKIQAIRYYKKMGNKTKANRIKMSLPYIFSSTLKKAYRAAENFESASFMIFDADKVTMEKLEELRACLKKDPLVFFYYISSSGKGIKIGVKLYKKILDASEYRDNYRFYKEQFEKAYQVDLDNTISCVSTSNLSYDEQLYYNPNSVPVKQYKQPQVIKSVYRMSSLEDQEIEKIREKCARFTGNLDYYDWIKCGAALSTLGGIGEDLFVLLSTGNESKDSEREIRRKYKSLENFDDIKIGTFFHILERHGV